MCKNSEAKYKLKKINMSEIQVDNGFTNRISNNSFFISCRLLKGEILAKSKILLNNNEIAIINEIELRKDDTYILNVSLISEETIKISDLYYQVLSLK